MIKDKCKSKGEKPLQISDMGRGLHLPTGFPPKKSRMNSTGKTWENLRNLCCGAG